MYSAQQMSYAQQGTQQRPESLVVTRTWHAGRYKVHEFQEGPSFEDVLVEEFMYFVVVFTCLPGELT